MTRSDDDRITRLRRLYRERIESQDAVHPGYAAAWGAFEALVLSHGGSLVVPPANPDPMIDVLARDGGVLSPYGIEPVAGARSDCHFNVVHLWLTGSIVAIGTGYALNGDLWREHSWGWNNEDQLIETTEARDRYFGVRMVGDQAKWFADWIESSEV